VDTSDVGSDKGERRFMQNISGEPAHVLATASGAETVDGMDESGS
jgi:hypothetical protein